MLQRLSLLSLVILIFLPVGVINWCKEGYQKTGKQIKAMVVSPSGRYLAVGHVDNNVRIYHTRNYIIVGTYSVGSTINALRFSGDGNYLAIATTDSNVRFLNGYQPFGLNTSFNVGVGNGIVGIDFSSDSSKFIACGGTGVGKISLWTLSNPGPWTSNTQILNAVPTTGNDCRISPLNGKIAVDVNTKMYFYDSALAGTLGASPYTTGSTTYSEIVWDPLNDFLLYIDTNGNQFYYQNAQTGATTVLTTTNILSASDFSSNGKYIATGGDAKLLHIFNSSRSLVEKWDTADKIKAIAFNKDPINSKLFAGDLIGNILILGLNCSKNCGPDYFYDNITCYFCGDYIAKCVTCINQTVCDECVDGYYVDVNLYTCKPCNMFGCLTCSSLNNCTECHSGFYITVVSSLNVCHRCSVMEGCAICNTSAICIACNNDYYLNTGTNQCKNCSFISNCIRCNNGTVCLQCRIGYFKTGAGACQVCDTNCLSCQGSSTNCSQCSKGWYVNMPTSYSCTRCQSNCLTCNSSNFCFQCTNGMYQKSDGTCGVCTFPCIDCQNGTNCYLCSQGYYLSGISCIPCASTCATCNTSAYCSTCQAGFYLTATTCKACPLQYNYCEYCSATACESCQMGYYLNTSIVCQHCSQKMFKCAKCTSDINCLLCIEGFYHTGLTANSSCKSCSAGCQTCIDGTDCRKCYNNYYLDGSLSCILCSGNCLQCSDSSTCRVCEEGYYLDGAVCKNCTQNLTNCLQCWNGTYCANCQIGFYLDTADYKCKQCASNCLTCDLTKCSSCDTGFYLTTGATPSCQVCSQVCTQCVTATNCTGCKSGFWLDSVTATCKNCSLNRYCRTCNSANCFSCLYGYYLDNTIAPPNYKCTSCPSKIEGCISCNASNYCFACDYGYYLDSATHLCVSCATLIGCQKCTIGTTCLICGMGYFLNTSNLCQVCQTGCSTCNSNGDCFTCSLGFYPSGIDCLPCKTNIEGCSLCSTSAVCSQCMNGYYLNAGTSTCKFCRTALIGCLYCSDSSTCTNCQPGFYLNAVTHKCVTCQTSMMGCDICLTSAVCVDCQNGYYLTGGGGAGCTLCTSSLSGCISCIDTNTCSICKTGFYLHTDNKCHTCYTANDGCQSCGPDGAGGVICDQCSGGFYLSNATNLCVACQTTGCQVCHQSNSSICITCDSLYYKSGTTCSKCSTNIEGCNECTNSVTCTTCEVGYFLTILNQCQLCQEVIPGCGKCWDNSGTLECVQCKSSYILNATTFHCETCFSVLQGCTYCVNTSACVSCSNGYFKDPVTHLCHSCTQQPGCLLCADSVVCEYCAPNHYLDNGTSQCVKCSIAIEFCLTCLQPTRCLSCQSGYIINSKFECEQVTVTATDKVQGLKMVTQYVDKDTLSHILYVQNSQYQNTSFNLTGLCTLYLTDYSLLTATKTISQIQLVIKGIKWLSTTKLQFLTNNPTNISSDNMGFVRRRLLASSNSNLANFKVSLSMTQQAVNTILPNLYQTGDLVMDFSLDQPEFYMSYLKYSGSKAAYYSIFGYIVSGLLLLNFIHKTYKIKTTQQLNHHSTGQIISHILSLKSITMFYYPITYQFYYFCYGFMLADLPWLNLEIGAIFGERSDYVPQQLVMYFFNLNIASTFLLSLAAFGVLMALRFIINKNKQLARNKYTKLIYCIFMFGLTFAGSLALQGALFNPIKKATVNSLFYLIGIVIYFGIFIEMLYSLYQSKEEFYKVRIFIKASLLSIAHMNPIIVVSISVITDILLLILQYIIIQKDVAWAKLWIINHLLVNLSLTAMFVLPNSWLSLIIAMTIISIVLIIQILLNCKLASYLQSKQKKANPFNEKQINRERVKLEPMHRTNNDSFQTLINDKQVTKFNLWDVQENDDFGSLQNIAAQDQRIHNIRQDFNSSQATKYAAFGNKNKIQDQDDGVVKRKPRNERKVSRDIVKSNPFKIESSSSSPTQQDAGSNEQKEKKKNRLHFLKTSNKIPVRSNKRLPEAG